MSKKLERKGNLPFRSFYSLKYEIERCDKLNNRRNRLLHIHRSKGITRRLIRLFFHYDSSLLKIYSLSPHELSKQFSFPLKNAKLFYQDLHSKSKQQDLLRDLKKYKTITIFDDIYPSVLKQIKDPPIVLYALGDPALLKHTPSISVIGTRQPSREAEQKMNIILKPLINRDWL